MRRVLGGLFLGLNLLLVAAFIAGYLARYVPPRLVWWLQLVAIGLPYLSLLVLGTTAIVWITHARSRKQRRQGWPGWAALHVGLVVLIAIRFVTPGRVMGLVPGRSAAPPEALTVMTYNAPGVPSPHGSWPEPESVISLARRETPDIVSFQEARVLFPRHKPVRPAPHVAALIDSLGYYTDFDLPPGHKPLSQPVLTRFPTDPHARIYLPWEWEEEHFDPRVVRVPFQWQGRQAVIYNVYLRSYGVRKPWEAEDPQWLDLDFWLSFKDQYRHAIHQRAQEAVFIKDLLANDPRPTLLMGDFNATPHSWTYGHLVEGLADAFHTAGQGWGGTYHRTLPLFRIDFILASPHWQVLDAYTAHAEASDHRPLLAHLRWRD